MEEFRQTDSYRDLFGIDGEPIGLTSLEILRKIQKDLQEQNIEPENFSERIIFMSMFNDIYGTRRGNLEHCFSNSEQVKNYAKKFMQGHWTFLGPECEKKWHGQSHYPPGGIWQDTAKMMVEQFEESGHPVFKGVSPLARGILGRRTTRRPYTSMRMLRTQNFIYRTIHSTNQLRIFGAVAKWCEDFGMKSDEKHPKTINDKILKVVQPTEVIALVKAPRTAQPAAGNSLREVLQNFVTFGTEVQFTIICEEAAFIHEVAVGSF